MQNEEISQSGNDGNNGNVGNGGNGGTTGAAASALAPGERAVLEKLALGWLREQRSRRRWNTFTRLITLLLVLASLWMVFGLPGLQMETVGPHTALIEIDGTIADDGGTGSAQAVVPALNKAFSDRASVGVVLRINSPGGSPVQAGIIADEMFRLRKEYPEKPLYVVINEMCASGGYYIAAASDRIYVNKASIVGSIGVLMSSFGVTGLMDKVGVERRLFTSGENKGFLDPFSPLNPKQADYASSMIAEIHQQFIDVVRQGRGERLKETPDTFSGLFWTGAKAVEMGLADDFGSLENVARDVLKAERIVDYTQQEGLPDRVLKKLGAAAGETAVRSIWNHAGVPAWR